MAGILAVTRPAADSLVLMEPQRTNVVRTGRKRPGANAPPLRSILRSKICVSEIKQKNANDVSTVGVSIS